MTQETKIVGKNHIIDFSYDGSLIAVNGFDASAKVFDASTLKMIFKVKLKGPKRELPTYYHQLSADNAFYVFSSLWQIFVVDLNKKVIIKEFEYSKKERLASIPLIISPSNILYYPDGTHISWYNVAKDTSGQIEIHNQAGYANWLAVSYDEQYLAYKSNNDHIGKQLFIINLKDLSQRIIPLPSDYVPKRRLSDAHFWFVENSEEIVVLRKGAGVSYFNYKTGAELKTIGYDVLGFRSLFSFAQSKVSSDGQYLLMNTEHSPNPDLHKWSVRVPDGFKYIMYNLALGERLVEITNGKNGMAFHINTGKIAYIRVQYENRRQRETLVIKDI